MKRIFLGLGIVAMSAVVPASANAQDLKKPQSETTQSSEIPDPPKFANEEANKGMQEFVSLARTYAPAFKTMDTAKLQEFAVKVQTWQQGLMTWVNSLTPEEQTSFQQYMEDVSKRLQPATGQES